LFWSGTAVLLSKSISLLSHFLLASILDVETFGVFAIVLSSMVFVSVFQRSGLEKVLISNQKSFSSLFQDYAAFIFIFSWIGSVILLLFGVFENLRRDIDGLLAVYIVASLTIPLVAVANLWSSKLSIDFRFKSLSQIAIAYSSIYYFLAISLAMLGFDIFTLSLSALLAALAQVMILRGVTEPLPWRFRLSSKNFFKYFVEFKWVLLTGVLSALAIRADFFILAQVLSLADMGLYYFGFMIVMSFTAIISGGINKTMLPIFAAREEGMAKFSSQVSQVSRGIIALSSLLSLSILLVGPIAIHKIWDGKWDGASSVIVLAAVFIPLRMLNVISHTIFEAFGKWRMKVNLLIFEIIILIVFTYTGALYFGLVGGAFGVMMQRVLSSILSYYLACKTLEIPLSKFFGFLLTSTIPFFSSLILHLYLSDFRMDVSADQYADIVANGFLVLSLWVLLSLAVNLGTVKKFLGLFRGIRQ
jgi:O-antigen/teichoic acid export membrane protein